MMKHENISNYKSWIPQQSYARMQNPNSVRMPANFGNKIGGRRKSRRKSSRKTKSRKTRRR